MKGGSLARNMSILNISKEEPKPTGVFAAMLSGDVNQLKSKKTRWKEDSLARLKVSIIHITLVSFFIFYICIGAIVFVYLEQTHELTTIEKESRSLEHMRAELLADMWDITDNDYYSEEQVKQVLNQRLDSFMEKIERTQASPWGQTAIEDYINKNNLTKSRWTFKSAVLLCLTITTGVGYGYISPRTKKGRLFCIVYGLIGVPIALLIMADFSKFFALWITKLYHACKTYVQKQITIFPCLPRKKKSKTRFNLNRLTSKTEMLASHGAKDQSSMHVPTWVVLCILISYPVIAGSIIGVACSSWTFVDSFYYGIVTMFTIGYGDIEPDAWDFPYFIGWLLFIFFGVTTVTMCMELGGNHVLHQVHYMGRQMGRAKAMAKRLAKMRPPSGVLNNLNPNLMQKISTFSNAFGMKGNFDQKNMSNGCTGNAFNKKRINRANPSGAYDPKRLKIPYIEGNRGSTSTIHSYASGLTDM